MSARRLFGEAPEHHQFYRNTFKQLSDIQQRQVGATLGAAVADAAVREYEWLLMHDVGGQESMQSFLAKSREGGASLNPPDHDDISSPQSLKDQEIAFPPVSLASRCGCSQEEDQSLLRRLCATPLRHRSLTGMMHHELLKVMMAARGTFEVDAVAPRWVSIAAAHPEAFGDNHLDLEHIVPIVTPFACVYPWADDEALWSFSEPFCRFLLTPTNDVGGSMGSTNDGAGGATLEGDIRNREEKLGACFMAQSVGLRYLQSNPNPVRNAALYCTAPGGSSILPHDVQAFIPDRGPSATACSSEGTLVSAVDAVRNARSFAHGIRLVIRNCATAVAGGSSVRFCGPAMLAGALLGSKFGVRSIPLEWISATRDHVALGTIAVDISQWTWNPPSK
jgi:hypothetical protein